jgi:PKHD-type hydroxylase
MNFLPTFPTEEVDIQNYYFFIKGFNDEELDKIYKDVEKISFEEATIGEEGKDNIQVRSSSIKWIPKSEEWFWLYDKLFNMTIEANNSIWHFNLFTAIDQIQYTEYYDTKNGHYDWHQDIGSGMLSKRKISITVQLSDSDEYDGGDLEYFQGGDFNKCIKAPRGKGVVFIFPSFMMHRVTQVTRGTRRSFVLWVGGEHYK